MMQRTRGFTFVELLVVLAIVSVIGGVVVSTYMSLQKTADSVHAAYLYVDALREAQQHALGMDYDSSWGAAIIGSTIVVFSGSTYATRTTTYDHVYPIAGDLVVTGATSTVFAKFTGLPTAAATSTFSNLYRSASTTVSSGGAIGYSL